MSIWRLFIRGSRLFLCSNLLLRSSCLFLRSVVSVCLSPVVWLQYRHQHRIWSRPPLGSWRSFQRTRQSLERTRRPSRRWTLWQPSWPSQWSSLIRIECSWLGQPHGCPSIFSIFGNLLTAEGLIPESAVEFRVASRVKAARQYLSIK